MTSWLDLLFNIIGYGGFVVLASHHPRTEVFGVAPETGADDGADPSGERR